MDGFVPRCPFFSPPCTGLAFVGVRMHVLKNLSQLETISGGRTRFIIC